MSQRLFGTDGVRGVANVKVTPELSFQIGRAAGQWVASHGGGRVVLGRDTRRSGPMLGAALASGFCSVGVDVTTLGVVPTGCVSHVVLSQGFAMGAVISASHNPAPDNGIKLIGPDGRKVVEEAERWIEANLSTSPVPPVTGAAVGELRPLASGSDAYVDWLKAQVPESLSGITVALDCGHGASYELAPRVFRELGAEIVTTGTNPDGMNINAEGGATKPETIQGLTQSSGADIGVAFDGDADRAVFSDDLGRLINGDRTMAIWCAHWRHHGRFDPPLVVGTVMTNGGFEKYMTAEGVRVDRVDVGDKYVSARLRETGGKIGGEQSGHIIFSDLLPTGDGLVTALQVCRVLKREGRKACDFFDDYASWPQLLVNVSVANKDGWSERPAVDKALREAESVLQGRGRLNVRPSGTQPMIRVMVEADDFELRDEVAERLVGTMVSELGGEIYSRVDLTHALGD